ncbi:MAG: DUF885 domain-containing protein [Bacteroidales bacterium]
MKKLIILFIVLTTTFVNCRESGKTSSSAKGDAKFQQLSEDFLAGYLAWRPELSVSLGFHEYDGKTSDLSKESLIRELTRLKSYDQMLNQFDTTSLSDRMFYDFRILQCGIKNEIFNFEEMESYTKNPMTYAGAMDVNIYIKRNFAPLIDRLKSIIAIEKKAPIIFAVAKSNLVDSLAKPFIETAIQIAKGSADFLNSDLKVALKVLEKDSLMAVFETTNNKAISELKAFTEYLEKEKLPKAHNNYALGREKYRKMLLYGEDISMPSEKILEIGLAELEREKDVFNATAKIIDPIKKPVEVYQNLQKEHPTSNSLIPDIKKNVEAIRQFLIDKKIITIPSEARVKVEETPKYARSTSTASMDTPGPFEKKATEAYYYITPVDPAWTAKQKEDWLSMFDYFTTDLTTIHEVYPGHYIQFTHLNASSATKIEKIFGSYAFIEGWAHYTEKMLIDEGYGNSGDPTRAAKYRLAQSGEALLRLCRLCVSIKMHCESMSVDDATKFFMNNWYHGEKPSRQEAIRGTFDPGYLYYTFGKLQILKLRKDYKKQEGDNFSLQKFHDLILENGMPPIQILRGKLLKDKNIWGDIL